jgi:hypothetical protein
MKPLPPQGGSGFFIRDARSVTGLQWWSSRFTRIDDSDGENSGAKRFAISPYSDYRLP